MTTTTPTTRSNVPMGETYQELRQHISNIVLRFQGEHRDGDLDEMMATADDAFLYAFERYDPCDPSNGTLQAYVGQVVARKLIDLHRKNKRLRSRKVAFSKKHDVQPARPEAYDLVELAQELSCGAKLALKTIWSNISDIDDIMHETGASAKSAAKKVLSAAGFQPYTIARAFREIKTALNW